MTKEKEEPEVGSCQKHPPNMSTREKGVADSNK